MPKLNVQNILTSLIISGITWLVYTTVDVSSELKLVNYKIDQIHKVLQITSEENAVKE